VSEHQRPLNRGLHFTGTLLGLTCLVTAFAADNPWWILGFPLCGYSFAWFGHFVIEKNRPATFRYPLWSLIADFHMFALMCLFRMDREVKRMGVLNAEA
jgi:hypothetical protein